MKKVKFNIPFFDKKHIKNINTLFKNKKLSGDQLFSKKCQEILKIKYKFRNVLLTDSCSSAFEIIATRLRNFSKKEIIIPSYSYPTIASSFFKNGFKVVFVDNQKDSPFINKEDLKKKISKNTGCIVIVHHYGSCEDIDYYLNLKKKHNLILIEDAAQSINLKYNSKFVGSFGDFGAISFHETKNIQCGLGGCLIINNKKYLKKTEYIWNRGTNRSDFRKKNIKSYSWQELGGNYYPSEFQSLILFNQLKNIKKIQNKRKQLYFHYQNGLKNLKSKYFYISNFTNTNFHAIYIICKNKLFKKFLLKKFYSKNIEVTSHYRPLHSSDFIKNNKLRIFKCKNAINFSDCILRLPLHLYLKKKEINDVIQVLENVNKS